MWKLNNKNFAKKSESLFKVVFVLCLMGHRQTNFHFFMAKYFFYFFITSINKNAFPTICSFSHKNTVMLSKNKIFYFKAAQNQI